MNDVSLALFWHQHQPYYPDDVSGENPMPWVRLHGTKDYWGMAMLLKETPEMHATINLVPSLLQQLLAYTEDGRQDTHQRVSRLPADALNEQDAYYLLDNFFMVHPDQMILPYPRYYELYKSAACRSTRPRGPANDSTRRTSSTCNAGRTWCGCTRWPSSKTPSWRTSARRAAAGRRKKSSGSWTNRWTC